MLKNYLKIAIRSLSKNKLFTVINLSGLAIGMASFFAIMLFVGYENSYDKFYEKHNDIYRVYMDYTEKGEFVAGDAQTYNLCGPTIIENIPEVLDYTRFYPLSGTSFEIENQAFETEKGYLADQSFFNMYQPRVLVGDATTALNEPNTIILTETMARKIYGKTEIIGKEIQAINNNQKSILRVTGVIKDIPENTHLKIKYLVSFPTYKNWNVFNPQKLNWNNNCFFTYLLIKNGVKINDLRQKLFALDIDTETERMNIEKMTDIHLFSDKPYEAEVNGNGNSVKFLFAIAAFIILLSWLNYINLSSAKMLERSKEVGIRKVSGAKKAQLIFQFISESFLLNFAALFIAGSLVALALPTFNTFIGKELSLNALTFSQITILIGIPVLGIFLSGLYPAIVLSSFAPVKVLKGKVSAARGGFSFHKGIVTAQFLATIILLIGTITILKQLKYMNNVPLGMNIDQTVSIKSTILDAPENANHSYQVLKEEIAKLSFVDKVSLAQTYPGEGFENIGTFTHMTFQDGTENKHTNWFNYLADENYVPLMGFKLLAGNNFTQNSATNKNKVIINERSAKLMGFADYNVAIGQKLHFWVQDFYISGVIKDYHHFGLKNDEQPIIIRYAPDIQGLIVKLKDNSASLAKIDQELASLNAAWQNIFPKSTFHYNFIDQKFASLYNEEKKFSQTFTFFTLLAIFIAMLGLFGLSYYRINQRIKEIGIRKVNGAKVSEILSMLNEDFIKWVAIAFVIASPIAYYAMHKWLENFAYKTNLSWWIFALAGVSALGIALLTVSWQSWRAAIRNPVEALRYE